MKHIETVPGMSTLQVAQRLGISQNMVWRLADRGRIAYRQTALGRLFDEGSVERLAAERAEQSRLDRRVRTPPVAA